MSKEEKECHERQEMIDSPTTNGIFRSILVSKQRIVERKWEEQKMKKEAPSSDSESDVSTVNKSCSVNIRTYRELCKTSKDGYDSDTDNSSLGWPFTKPDFGSFTTPNFMKQAKQNQDSDDEFGKEFEF